MLSSQISVASRRASLLRSSCQSSSPMIAASRRALSTTTPTRSVARSPLATSSIFPSTRKLSPASLQASRFFHASPAFLAETVKVPQMAESISEGTLKQWNKKKGDFVKADEEVAVIETDKIDVTVNAPQSGTITETLANEEDTVTVGQDLFKLEPGEAPAEGSSGGEDSDKKEQKDDDKEQKQKQESEQKDKEEQDKKNKEQEQKKEQEQEASKQKQQKQESEQKQSSSPSKPQQQQQQPSQSSSSSSSSSSKPPAGSRGEQRVKMNRMRLRIAERLKQSQNTAASLTTFNEIDMSAIMAFRARHKDRLLKERGVKLGFMGAFARASALALKEIPAANASIEGEGLGDTIVYRDYVDLSVAVSTEKGLVTPVVRNVESLSILEIENEISALGKKARDNKLTIEDMTGGTFTISNGGVFGSLFGTPILNLPGSAILGMHAINEKPWVVTDSKGNKTIDIRPVMVIALTYDHRLLDGREAVTCLKRIKEYLEDPALMSL
ncbi:unnamed protein product [Sympodiomycopsis kandeliae]